MGPDRASASSMTTTVERCGGQAVLPMLLPDLPWLRPFSWGQSMHPVKITGGGSAWMSNQLVASCMVAFAA